MSAAVRSGVPTSESGATPAIPAYSTGNCVIGDDDASPAPSLINRSTQAPAKEKGSLFSSFFRNRPLFLPLTKPRRFLLGLTSGIGDERELLTGEEEELVAQADFVEVSTMSMSGLTLLRLLLLLFVSSRTAGERLELVRRSVELPSPSILRPPHSRRRFEDFWASFLT